MYTLSENACQNIQITSPIPTPPHTTAPQATRKGHPHKRSLLAATGHPQGMALLYTMLRAACAACAYSRATPCGWPAPRASARARPCSRLPRLAFSTGGTATPCSPAILSNSAFITSFRLLQKGQKDNMTTGCAYSYVASAYKKLSLWYALWADERLAYRAGRGSDYQAGG